MQKATANQARGVHMVTWLANWLTNLLTTTYVALSTLPSRNRNLVNHGYPKRGVL